MVLDIVGFDSSGVKVALGTGRSFLNPETWSKDFSSDVEWQAKNTLRELTDVNGDGIIDLMGINAQDVKVALGHGTGFGIASTLTKQLGKDRGWSTARTRDLECKAF
jgi:hypothetical protein